MFEKTGILFLYGVTPVHMGGGTALGAIDSPIQREVHTGHPSFAGSGIKGALRHLAEARRPSRLVEVMFGPPTNRAADHAGALAFGDAQVVLFPVRSLRGTFAYATCPTALMRLARLASIAGVAAPPVVRPASQGEARVTSSAAQAIAEQQGGAAHVVLEAYRLSAKKDGQADALADWLVQNAFPEAPWAKPFKEHLARALVVLHDDVFLHFVQHGTLVEPHVRIDDETGTADDGGLFYVENLPPEALMAAPVFVSRSRRQPKEGEKEEDVAASADDIAAALRELVGVGVVQIGGDATTGRGQVACRLTLS